MTVEEMREEKKHRVRAIEICNDCECDKKCDCVRYDKELLALYDFEFIRKHELFNCFIQNT